MARIDEIDVLERYKIKGEDDTIPLLSIERTSPPPRKILSWGDGDQENSYSWSSVLIKEMLS